MPIALDLPELHPLDFLQPRVLRIQCHEAVRVPERLELVAAINMAGSRGASRCVRDPGRPGGRFGRLARRKPIPEKAWSRRDGRLLESLPHPGPPGVVVGPESRLKSGSFDETGGQQIGSLLHAVVAAPAWHRALRAEDAPFSRRLFLTARSASPTSTSGRPWSVPRWLTVTCSATSSCTAPF